MSINKLYSIGPLKKIVHEHRINGSRIVFANGCFDLMHIGHVRYLVDASNYGDILIVGINSDASVKRLKGSERPVFSQLDRAEFLSAFECINYITIFEEDDVSALLLTLKPDFHAKGTDYTQDSVPEKDVVRSYGGKVIITGDKKTRSSRDLLEFFQKI